MQTFCEGSDIVSKEVESLAAWETKSGDKKQKIRKNNKTEIKEIKL